MNNQQWNWLDVASIPIFIVGLVLGVAFVFIPWLIGILITSIWIQFLEHVWSRVNQMHTLPYGDEFWIRCYIGWVVYGVAGAAWLLYAIIA